MSMRSDAASFRSHSHHWNGLNHVLCDWWQRQRSRHELETLDDTILRDIGLSRGERGFEASKRFWLN